MLRAMMAATLLVTPIGGGSAAIPDITIALRVFVHAPVDPTTLQMARASLTELLRPMQIGVEWRECRTDETQCRTENTVRAVVVRVVPTRLPGNDECGRANPQDEDGGVILVFLPCHDDLVRTVRTKAMARSEPGLATLELGHLLGLTMAHELGHILGLTHASAGVMQARFDMEDLIELRASRLGFTPHERVQIRQAITSEFRELWALRPEP
jgi:hypothetical protein